MPISSLVPFLAAMAAALPGFAQDTSLLRYDGPDRAGKLVAAAQKEGWFALYTSFAEKDLPPLIVLFEKKYGVKVRIWRAGSENVLQRTLTEAAARRREVDAIHSSALEMETLHREKILQAATSRMSGIGIARRAPHPNAALLFYDFMLSAEAQELLVAMEYAPTHAGVPSPLATRRFTLVDPALALDQNDKWAKSFEEVMLKRGGQ